jgi:hypothetical protein
MLDAKTTHHLASFDRFWEMAKCLKRKASTTLSTLLPGIVESYNNAFIVQFKASKDCDLMMAHLALSDNGFVDVESH